MRTRLKLLTFFIGLCAGFGVTHHVLAQGMGGGMGGGGMGGGGMGGGGGGRGGGGHHRGQGQGGQGDQGHSQGGPQAGPHAPASVSVQMRLNGVVTVVAQAKAISHTAVNAAKPDLSAIYVERNGALTLDTVQLMSSGEVSQIDDGRSAGLDAALLIASGSSATMTAGTITTLGKGANAAFASDAGSHLSLHGTAITTRASDAYAIEATDGASIEADALTVTTESDHAAAVATRTPDSHVTLNGGAFVTHGPLSPVLSVGGAIMATGITARAEAADAIVMDGPHRIVLNASNVSADDNGATIVSTGGGAAGPGGAMHDGSGPGGFHARGGDGPPHGDRPGRGGPDMTLPSEKAPPEAQPLPGVAAMPMHDGDGPEHGEMHAALALTDGQFKARHALFYVSNIKAFIVMTHVEAHSDSGVLIRSAADQWGPLGQNGGDAFLEAHHQRLEGDFVTDAVSSINVNLSDDSHFTGKATPNVDITLDASSTWTLTDDGHVGKLIDAAIVGDSVSNINGNGHTLTYSARHNPALERKTYQLAGGGQLVPGI